MLQARAQPLAPGEWRAMLRGAVPIQGAAAGEGPGGRRDGEAAERRPVVLDVRNAYEWDAGHFLGAERPREARAALSSKACVVAAGSELKNCALDAGHL